jgi:hypothetical protein
MEAVRSSETSVNFSRTTRRHIPEIIFSTYVYDENQHRHVGDHGGHQDFPFISLRTQA